MILHTYRSIHHPQGAARRGSPLQGRDELLTIYQLFAFIYLGGMKESV